MIAPVAAIGWPSAIAPPFGLTFARSSSRSWQTARDWAANASFSSITSTSSSVLPARASALRTAGTGPIPIAPSPKLATATRLRLATAAHADPRFLFFLAGVLPVTVIFFQHISSMPLFIVRDLKLSAATFGLLFSLNCLLIVVFEIPLNAATAHWPHRQTLALGAVLSGAGFGAMAFARDAWTLAATVMVWTLGEMLFFPASAAYATDIAPDERRGEYSGLYTMVFSAAFAIGPWAGTVVLERLGARTLWGGTFVLGLIAASMFLRLPEPRTHHALPEQTLPDAAGPAEI